MVNSNYDANALFVHPCFEIKKGFNPVDGFDSNAPDLKKVRARTNGAKSVRVVSDFFGRFRSDAGQRNPIRWRRAAGSYRLADAEATFGNRNCTSRMAAKKQ